MTEGGNTLGRSEPLEQEATRYSRIWQKLRRRSGEGGRIVPRSSYALLAGWMTVIAGVLTFFNGFRTLIGETSWNLLEALVDLNRYSLCAVVIMVFGAVAIAGGISAIRGKNLSLALAGAALGMIGDGIAGFWLGIGAILFLFLSSEDF
jgi:Flp pilus assembly pilin Flp